MAAANCTDLLQRAYDNYCRIWLMLTEKIAAGTLQRDIDLLTSAAESAGVPRPKVTYSENGRSVDWTGYQSQLADIMAKLRVEIKASDPAGNLFELHTQGW